MPKQGKPGKKKPDEPVAPGAPVTATPKSLTSTQTVKEKFTALRKNKKRRQGVTPV